RARGIAVDDREPVLIHVLPDDSHTPVCMEVVEGGGAEVYHDVGRLLHKGIHRAGAVEAVVPYVPDVFADGDCQFKPFELEYIPFESGLEVAVLIKYVVGG